MSNHYPIVLRVNKTQADQLTEREAMEHCARLYKNNIANEVINNLEALNIAEDNWLDTITNYTQRFYRAVGKQQNIKNYCNKLNQQWLKGVGAANQLYQRKNVA